MNSGGAGLGNLLVLALPLLLLGFLMFTQRKRARQMQDFQSSLSVGDDVVMTSGLYGRIVTLDDVAATLEVAPGVQVKVDRRGIGLKQPGETAPSEGPHPSGGTDQPGSAPGEGN